MEQAQTACWNSSSKAAEVEGDLLAASSLAAASLPLAEHLTLQPSTGSTAPVEVTRSPALFNAAWPFTRKSVTLQGPWKSYYKGRVKRAVECAEVRGTLFVPLPSLEYKRQQGNVTSPGLGMSFWLGTG